MFLPPADQGFCDLELRCVAPCVRVARYRPILTAFQKLAAGGKCSGMGSAVRHPAAMLSQDAKPLHFSDPVTKQEWFRPTTLVEYSAAIGMAPGKRIRPVCANTSTGVAKSVSIAHCLPALRCYEQ